MTASGAIVMIGSKTLTDKQLQAAVSAVVAKIRTLDPNLEVRATHKPVHPASGETLIGALQRDLQAKVHAEVMQRYGLVIDLASRSVTVDGIEDYLGPTEHSLLTILLREPGAHSREELERRIWAAPVHIDTLRGLIRRTRSTLRPAYRRLLFVERNVGYGFRVDETVRFIDGDHEVIPMETTQGQYPR